MLRYCAKFLLRVPSALRLVTCVPSVFRTGAVELAAPAATTPVPTIPGRVVARAWSRASVMLWPLVPWLMMTVAAL